MTVDRRTGTKLRGEQVYGGTLKILLRLAILTGIILFPVMLYWPNYQDWRMRRAYEPVDLEILKDRAPGKVKFYSDRSRYADTRIIVLVGERGDAYVVEVASVDTPMEQGDVYALAEGASAEYFGYWTGSYIVAHDIRGSIMYFKSNHRDYLPPEISQPSDSRVSEPPLAELDTLRVESLWDARARKRYSGRVILALDPNLMRYRDEGFIGQDGCEYEGTMGYVILLNHPGAGPEPDERQYGSILNTIMREKLKGATAVINYVPENNKVIRQGGRLGVAQIEQIHLPNRTLRLR